MNVTGKLKKPVEPIKMLKGIIRSKSTDKPALSRADQLKELQKIKQDIDGQIND